MDLKEQNLPPDNDRFYTEYDPKTDTHIVKEDPDQKEKDEIVSKIQDVDPSLEQNLSECNRRNMKKFRRKLKG